MDKFRLPLHLPIPPASLHTRVRRPRACLRRVCRADSPVLFFLSGQGLPKQWVQGQSRFGEGCSLVPKAPFLQQPPWRLSLHQGLGGGGLHRQPKSHMSWGWVGSWDGPGSPLTEVRSVQAHAAAFPGVVLGRGRAPGLWTLMGRPTHRLQPEPFIDGLVESPEWGHGIGGTSSRDEQAPSLFPVRGENWNPRAPSPGKTLGSVFPQPSSPPPRGQSCQVAGKEAGRSGERRAGGGGWSRRRAPSLGAGGWRGAARRQRRRRVHGENDRPPRSGSGRAAARARAWARARAPARARAQPRSDPARPGCAPDG